MSRLPIAILISGRGSNMRVIVERAAAGTLPVDVRVVVSDKPSAEGLSLAADMNIATRVLEPRDFPDRPAYDRALVELLRQFQPQLVLLAGFMRILTPQFIGAFAGRMLNVHPSLLPKYPGLHTHRRCLEAGDAAHGASIHFVTEQLDGGPVVLQAEVPVVPGDTEITLSARVQQAEHKIYPQAIDWFARGRLLLQNGRAWLDGKPLDAPLREPSPAVGG
ncbi:MAG TPA: phosphoribosylglycinamide formyltransferase [Steroidobacteraceae bacterium]|jgi:phosphoribosylglycinamide formyltransferase-1|nr:phosphoribosylglycinamide formyltransferase [Steroidobacteraceae bacterium]